MSDLTGVMVKGGGTQNGRVASSFYAPVDPLPSSFFSVVVRCFTKILLFSGPILSFSGNHWISTNKVYMKNVVSSSLLCCDEDTRLYTNTNYISLVIQ